MNRSPAFGNITVLAPYLVTRYSTLAVQFGTTANSMPIPAAQPNRHRNGESIVPLASCVSVSWLYVQAKPPVA
jgi:hypothetical protein